jgi:methionine sulfoxide reductase heme-binding subunit
MSGLLHGPFLWYATRAAGLVTLVLLTAGLALGILNAGRLGTQRWPRFVVQSLHRNISLLALAFLALHVGTTVIDSYTSIGLPDAFIPFLSSYKRWWLGLGALASDLMLTLAITSMLRHRIGQRLWRAIHWAGYLCWPVAMAHGLGTGTDHSQGWVVGLAIACGAAVAGSVAYRIARLARDPGTAGQIAARIPERLAPARKLAVLVQQRGAALLESSRKLAR